MDPFFDGRTPLAALGLKFPREAANSFSPSLLGPEFPEVRTQTMGNSRKGAHSDIHVADLDCLVALVPDPRSGGGLLLGEVCALAGLPDPSTHLTENLRNASSCHPPEKARWGLAPTPQYSGVTAMSMGGLMRALGLLVIFTASVASARPMETKAATLVYREPSGTLSFGRAPKGTIVLQYPAETRFDPMTWIRDPSLPTEGRIRVLWSRSEQETVGWVDVDAVKDAVPGAYLNHLKRWFVAYAEVMDSIVPPGRATNGLEAAQRGYNIYNASLQYVSAALKANGGDDLPDLLLKNCVESRVEHFAKLGQTMPEDKRLDFCDFSKPSPRAVKPVVADLPAPSPPTAAIRVVDIQQGPEARAAPSEAPVTADDVEHYVIAREETIQSCYDSEWIRHRNLSRGTITMRFAITPSGRVADITIEENTLGSEAVATCAKSTIRTWAFPFRPGEKVVFTHQFKFK